MRKDECYAVLALARRIDDGLKEVKYASNLSEADDWIKRIKMLVESAKSVAQFARIIEEREEEEFYSALDGMRNAIASNNKTLAERSYIKASDIISNVYRRLFQQCIYEFKDPVKVELPPPIRD